METSVKSADSGTVEELLRRELADDDAAAETVAPVLRHLLSSDDNLLFSDEIVARVRGMLGGIATQILDLLDEVAGIEGRAVHDAREMLALTNALLADARLLCHLHALSIEWQLTERLRSRTGLDPVLSPLLQALIASPEAAIAEMAMNFLAAQARFCQSQRRMGLPLAELPGDHLHTVLLAMPSLATLRSGADEHISVAERLVRSEYDEAANRLGLLGRLVTGMGCGAVAALSIGHAGSAIFLSALAARSGQSRDAAALSTTEGQRARLILALRAAGLKPAMIEEQFMTLHPDKSLPEDFVSFSADRAAEILAVGRHCPGE